MCDLDHIAIPLHAKDGSVRSHAIVDSRDYDTVGHLRWYESSGYAVRGEGNTTIYMHRVILGLQPGDGIKTDHRDRRRSNNCRENLRSGTQAQNLQNLPAHKNAVSRHRGVYFRKDTGRWRAEVEVGGVRHNLGSFKTEDEAGAAAREARANLMTHATD